MTFVLSSNSENKQRRYGNSSIWHFLFVRPFHGACVIIVPRPSTNPIVFYSFLPSILSHPTCYSRHHYSLPLTIRVLKYLHFQHMSIHFHSIYLPNTCLAILSTVSFPTLSSCCPVSTCRSAQILTSDYQVCLKPRLDDTAPTVDVTQSISMAVRHRNPRRMCTAAGYHGGTHVPETSEPPQIPEAR
jgi:hypothetical protein